MKTYKDYLNIITLDLIQKEYEENNLSIKEFCDKFNISSGSFIRILKYYNFHKSKESHAKQIKKQKTIKYGNPNYNNSEKTRKTNLEKYGVDNQFKRADLFPQIYNKRKSLYGSYNNIEKNHQTRIQNSGSLEESYKQQIETYKQTCLGKYGVTNAAQTEETKEKIRESLKQTFNEKYLCDNYWTYKDAKRSNGSKNSKANLEFKTLLEKNDIKYEQEFLLNNKWYDFKIDNFLIEINPTATHNLDWSPYSEKGIDRDYHRLKSLLAQGSGYRCIQVYDWDNINKIIKLFKNKEKIMARKCEIKEVNILEAQKFINENHLQNYAKDKIRIGLFYNNELVSIMTFGKPRYNRNYEYELIRYCSSKNIIGGAEKLFNYFLKTYSPKNVISYCDFNKFNGDTYIKLGCKKLTHTQGEIHWYNIKTKQHITDNLLRQQGFDRLFKTDYGKGTSNEELMFLSGFVRICGAGQISFGYENKEVD